MTPTQIIQQYGYQDWAEFTRLTGFVDVLDKAKSERDITPLDGISDTRKPNLRPIHKTNRGTFPPVPDLRDYEDMIGFYHGRGIWAFGACFLFHKALRDCEILYNMHHQ